MHPEAKNAVWAWMMPPLSDVERTRLTAELEDLRMTLVCSGMGL